jgi:RNA-directed DNA polymerase
VRDKRRKIQLELAFAPGARSEASSERLEGIEARAARAGFESQAVVFGSCMEEIVERDNLKKALAQVRRNKGAPGIDGMKVDELGSYLKEQWPAIRAALLEGSYKPQPAKRVEIPKATGGTRALGIPTVLDRFIQQAVLQVLQLAWDGSFSEHSFGFRPGRSAHQAVARAQELIAAGHRTVVDIDIEKFLDRAAYCTPAYEAWLKSSGCEPMSLRRKPFLRPHRTWMASISPRLTRCHTVCRETPSRRMAWYMVR